MVEKQSKKIASVLFLAVSLVVLFLSLVNISALRLTVTEPSPTSLIQGENVSFQATLKIYEGESLSGYIELQGEGYSCALCKFNIVGNPVSGCNGTTIKRISSEENYLNGGTVNLPAGFGNDSEIIEGGVYSNTENIFNITINSRILHQGNNILYIKASNLYKTTISDEVMFNVVSTNNQTNENQTSQNNTVTPPFQNRILNYSKGGSNITTDLGFDFEIYSNKSGKINITTYNSLSDLNLAGVIGLANLRLFKINLTENNVTGNSTGLNYVIIKVKYTDEEISQAGLIEDSLRLYYYNEKSGTWEIFNDSNGGVNTSENYVWAKTNHFSVWSIFGEKILLPAPPAPSGGGGGGGGSSSGGGIITTSAKINKTASQNTTNASLATGNQTQTVPVNNSTETTDEKKSSGITGAVIGAANKIKNSKVLISVIVLIVIYIILHLSLMKWRKDKESKDDSS